MLETLAGTLLQSIESLAEQELSLNWNHDQRFYIPMIVTNAKLFLHKFDTSDIDISQGTLLKEHSIFESVTAIKFRKSLSTHIEPIKKGADLLEAGSEQERTVFIINESGIEDFFDKFKPLTDFRIQPWVEYRS